MKCFIFYFQCPAGVAVYQYRVSIVIRMNQKPNAIFNRSEWTVQHDFQMTIDSLSSHLRSLALQEDPNKLSSFFVTLITFGIILHS